MKKYWLVSFVVASVAIGAWQLYAQSPTQQRDGKTKLFMHKKLDHAKSILEGLVMEDAEKIAVNSQALSLLSLEGSWNVHTTEKYLQHSIDFRKAADSMTKSARENNIDRATLGFVDLTLRCVECHKYVREKNGPGQSINVNSDPIKPK